MASVAVAERRHDQRVAGGGPRFGASAVMRPGQAVVLVNICSRGALVEASVRLRPGAQTELHLGGDSTRARVKGRLQRCHVVGIEPMRYHGVVVFDEHVDLGAADQG